MWYMKFFYTLLLVVSFLFICLYDKVFSLILFMILLLLMIFQFIFVCYIKRKLSAEIEIKNQTIQCGESIPVFIHLKNHSFLPVGNSTLNLRLQNTFTSSDEIFTIRLPIQAKFTSTITIYVTAKHCGIFNISAESLYFMDYLKLFSRKILPKTNGMCTIFPTKIDIPGDLISIQQESFVDSPTYSTTKSGDDASEVFQIREFQNQDRPNRIHWKLSSRYEKIFVKDYSLPLQQDFAIVLKISDFPQEQEQNKNNYVDLLLKAMFSVSDLAVKQKQNYTILHKNRQDVMCKTDITTESELYNEMYSIISETGKNIKSEKSIIQNFIDSSGSENFSAVIYFIPTISKKEIDILSNERPYQQHFIFITNIYDVSEKSELPLNIKVIPITDGALNKALTAVCI